MHAPLLKGQIILFGQHDVLFVGRASKPTAMVIKQARQLGFKGGFILMDQAKLEEMEQTLPLVDLTGGVGVMPVSQSPDPGVSKFVSAFKAEYNNKLPNSEMALNYSGMKIVAKGIEKSGSIDDPAKIFKGMQDAMPMNGGVLPYEINSLSAAGVLSYEVKGVMIIDGKYGPAIPIPQQ